MTFSKKGFHFASFMALVLSVHSAAASSLSEAVTFAYQARADAQLIRGCAIGLMSNSVTEKLVLGDVNSEFARLEIGSISKSLTGIVAALFSVQQKLDLEAPIFEYIPELAGSYVGTVSVHQLATHSARLVNAYTDGTGAVSETYSEAQLVTFLKDYIPDPKRFPPGIRSYSNLGFATLGLVLSRIEKMAFPEILRRELLAPLRMTSTSFITSDQRPTGLLQGYNVLLETANYAPESELAAASGGVISNLHDMSIYLENNLRPPATQLGQAIWLSHQLGLGWDSDPGTLPIWKNGAMPAGFSSYIAFDPTLGKEFGAIVLSNALNTSVAMGLGSIAMGSWDSYLPLQALSPIDASIVAKILGQYHTSDGGIRLKVESTSPRRLTATVTTRDQSTSLRLYNYNSSLFLVDTGVEIADLIRLETKSEGALLNLVYLSYQGLDSVGRPIYESLQLFPD